MISTLFGDACSSTRPGSSSRQPGRRGLGAVAGLIGLALVACGGGGSDAATSSTGPAAGEVQAFEDLSQTHTEDPVDYAQTPPVGGDHAPVWQNCGFYPEPVAEEAAVHSLEHGAVWITYAPGLDRASQETLAAIAGARPYVLVSPWDGEALPAPLVLSAWGAQLELEDIDDPGFDEFLATYLEGVTAPEPGAPCTRGDGVPG